MQISKKILLTVPCLGLLVFALAYRFRSMKTHVLDSVETLKRHLNGFDIHVQQEPGFIHLFQQLVSSYEYKPKRRTEFLESLQSNINHQSVRKVYVLEENWNEREIYQTRINDTLQKVQFLPFGRQPNYSDIFHIVTRYIHPQMLENEVWMVTNADIILGEGFSLLYGNIEEKHLVALSRHGKFCKEHNQCYNFFGSFDSFIGRGIVEENIISRLNVPQNTYGSENFMLYNFQKAGYKLSNPCKSVKVYHNHCSGERSWLKLRPKRVNKFGKSASPMPSTWIKQLNNTKPLSD